MQAPMFDTPRFVRDLEGVLHSLAGSDGDGEAPARRVPPLKTKPANKKTKKKKKKKH